MGHKLHDITLYYPMGSDPAATKRFALKKNVVSELYVHCLNGYKPPKTTRISVDLTNYDHVYDLVGSSILRVDIAFDMEHFWKQSDETQQKLILETIHRAAILSAETYDWDKKPFENAYREVLRRNFVYVTEGKTKTSGDRQYKAAIQISKNEKWSELSVVFYNKQGDQIKSVELFKSLQSELFYGEIIKNTKWFTSREFGVHAYNEELIIKASMDLEDSVVVCSPGKYDREFLEGYLKSISYMENEEQWKQNFVKWSNR